MTRVATTRPRRAAVSEDYLALIRELPIRPLKTTADYKAALSILDRLIGRQDLSPGQRDYLAALIRFVKDYEQDQRMGEFEKLKPLELLKFLMEENDMTTTDLGLVLGSRGLASEVLNGKRGLSKMAIAKLSHRFSLPPGLFLDSTNRA